MSTCPSKMRKLKGSPKRVRPALETVLIAEYKILEKAMAKTELPMESTLPEIVPPLRLISLFLGEQTSTMKKISIL